jgi:hypothetical protein
MHQMPDLSRVTWRKSSYSNGSGGSCVEIADVDPHNGVPGARMVAVRDSKDRSGPVLVFTTGQWRAFTAQVRAGEGSVMIAEK